MGPEDLPTTILPGELGPSGATTLPCKDFQVRLLHARIEGRVQLRAHGVHLPCDGVSVAPAQILGKRAGGKLTARDLHFAGRSLGLTKKRVG